LRTALLLAVCLLAVALQSSVSAFEFDLLEPPRQSCDFQIALRDLPPCFFQAVIDLVNSATQLVFKMPRHPANVANEFDSIITVVMVAADFVVEFHVLGVQVG
jgi:hypothetical protein